MRSQKGKDKWVPTTEAGPSNPRVRNELMRQKTDLEEYDDMFRGKV
jgi:hypothetical protein